jgi:drug/metabolite transporter (DMT)-like permease
MAERGSRAAAPVVAAVLVMVVWGATPILTRLALEDMEPLLVATLRTVVAGVLAVPLIAMARLPAPRSPVTRKLLAVSGLAGFVVFPVVYTVGQERTSGLHGVMILAALPVFTGLYASAVARRRPARHWIAGSAVALVGEVVLIAGRGDGEGDATVAGDLIVLAAALVVSAGYVAGALLPPRGVPSSAATYWGVLLGAVVLSPLLIGVLGADGLPEAGATAWGAVLFLAIVTSIVGYIGWYWALDRGGIQRIATLQFLQPVSGFALAAVVLGDRVTLPIAAGSALVVAGVVVAQRS